MKKTISAVSGLMLLTFFIIVTVNAQSNDPKASKANNEIKKDVSDDAVINVFPGMSGKKMSGCCSGVRSAMNFDAAKCQRDNCDQANCANVKCGQAAQRSNCGRTASGMMSGPMNCARDMTVAAK